MKTLLTAVLLLATPFAYADEIGDLKKDEAKINSQIEKSNVEMKRLINNIAPMTKDFISFGCVNNKGTFDLDKCKLEKINKKANVYGKLRTNWNSLQADLNAVMKSMAQLRENALSIKTKHTALAEGNATRAPAEAIQSLLKINKVQAIEDNVMAKWNEADQKFEDLDKTMDELERSMDASAIGLYFQDKMTQYMNSELLCRANKRCQTGKDVEDVIEDRYIKQLFPNYSSGKTGRTGRQSYDKTKNRRGSQ